MRLTPTFASLALGLLSLSSLANANVHSHLKRAPVTADPAIANGQTFDYIVVGGGLAGVTVAARLAEDASVTVLLIEAGNDDRNDPRIYDIYNYGTACGTNILWSWPTDRCKGLSG